MIDGCEIQPLTLEGPRLVRDHREAFERVAQFFPAGPPHRIDTFRRAAEAARERISDEGRRGLGETLQPCGATARRQLDRFIREKGVVVTTGQQAGLFTGPLYALYKALTAVRFAAHLEDELGLPVLPVFWIASEDHDWDEVSHVHVVDLENRLERIEVAAPVELSAQSAPIYRLAFGPDVAEAAARLDRATPDSEYKADLLGPLGKAYRPGANVHAAFAAALGDLLQDTNLCLAEASSPWIKRHSAPILAREWERRREVGERLAGWAAELGSRGYEAQVSIDPKATNLFLEGPAGRDRLVLEDDGGAHLRRSGHAVSDADLRGVLESEPRRVSPNVLLRPVVESALLPVAATVAGPAEIAYHAETPPLFEIHGVPPPPVVPRASFRLLEARVSRALEKTGVSPEALMRGAEAAAREFARHRVPVEIESSLESLRSALARGFERLDPAALSLDPALEGALGRARSAAEKALRELEGKITSSVQRQNVVVLEQLRKAAVHLAPLGQPQERVLNAYPYLVRYGRALIAEIAGRVQLPLDADR